MFALDSSIASHMLDRICFADKMVKFYSGDDDGECEMPVFLHLQKDEIQ